MSNPKRRTTVASANGPSGATGKTETLRFRIAPDLKSRAEAVFHEMGLESNDVVRFFFQHVASKGKLPFKVSDAMKRGASKSRTEKANVPNAKTQQVLREMEAGEGLSEYENMEDLYRELGI
jgi:DNA-damage-inducible protein J